MAPVLQRPNTFREGLSGTKLLGPRGFHFGPGILSITGFPVILRDALETVFNPNGTVKEEREPAAPEATVEDAPEQPRRGPKPKWDWDGAVGYLLTVANGKDGLPESQAEIEGLVADWFSVLRDR